jgi:hypothetical protein
VFLGYFGQSVHFRVYAPEKISYATNRYAFEARRHAGILDARLAKQKYMLGDTYTIVDMNVWGWARPIPTVLGDGGWEKFPNLKRLADEISARPAAQKATALKERHKFKTEMDAEAMQAMFPHLNVKVETASLRRGSPCRGFFAARPFLPPRWVMSGDARLAYVYHAFGMAFLRRCYHQILGPRRYLSQFADGLCRHCNAWFHLNPHMTWQATKRYVQRANAFELVFHVGLLTRR